MKNVQLVLGILNRMRVIGDTTLLNSRSISVETELAIVGFDLKGGVFVLEFESLFWLLKSFLLREQRSKEQDIRFKKLS